MKRTAFKRGTKMWKYVASDRSRRHKFLSQFSPSLQKWSKQIRERDNYTCQRCGKQGKADTQAHHVAPRSRRPDLKLELSNGITVCFDCHRWIHNNPIEATKMGLLSTDTYELALKEIK